MPKKKEIDIKEKDSSKNLSKKITIPESFEINTLDYLSLIKSQKTVNKKLINDLNVYMKIISLIISLPINFFENEYYISMKDVQKICANEFKNLSKNWKE